MSYPTFVAVMNQHDIQDTTELEYHAAWNLYIQDLSDGDTDSDFKTWLVDHIVFNVMAGY